MANNKPVLVMTALTLERDAILEHLVDVKVEKHPDVGTDYSKGIFKSEKGPIDVVVGRTDQSNINAALETERAIQYYQPNYAFYIGVAGGIKDVKVGDIVIGTDVIGYERGKATQDNFHPRPQFGASSYDLERSATSYSGSDSWAAKCNALLDPTFAPKISVYSGTIASGEKVDASYKSELHKHLLQNASHALAIEMEGLGFLKVCMMRPNVKSLLLRGISDLVNDKGEMDEQGSQPYASSNVAAFFFGLLYELAPVDKGVKQTKFQDLIEVACKLYPRGVEDRSLWVRSGGDLALLRLNTTGKSQWFEAIRLIELGGGGAEISTQTLVSAMREDFPNNSYFKELIY